MLKRGYYYKSWMTIVNLVAMAKDLELHQHYELHRQESACYSTSDEECSTKTRIWHMLFAVEMIVGGPQGMNFQDCLLLMQLIVKRENRIWCFY